MALNIFSVPIFFILFRETLEASVVISVLLSLVDQLVASDPSSVSTSSSSTEEPSLDKKRLKRRLRIQIFVGCFAGLFLALAIGSAFIVVWFKKASNLWEKTENLWEGVLWLIAAIIIFFMGITMLRMDRAEAKWRVKMQKLFSGQHVIGISMASKYAFLLLPFITVIRESFEAVIFVSGVSFGQPAKSIPLAAILGICCGLLAGFLLYSFASRFTLTIFLVVTTNILLLIGAGLFSKSVSSFREYTFKRLTGGEEHPGVYDIRGSLWHLRCCNPEEGASAGGNGGWLVFSGILGWNNDGSVGSVLAYVFYWLAAALVLIYMKYSEGRVRLFGFESKKGKLGRLEGEEREKERDGAPNPESQVQEAAREERKEMEADAIVT